METIINNMSVDNKIYNKGCLVFGSVFFIGFMWISVLLKIFFEGLKIHLPSLIIIVWGSVWTISVVVILHSFAIIKSKGILRGFYLISLWFLQSYYVGAVVWGNISKDPYVQYSYIAIFSCIVLASYCIFFSPLLFLKLHINPRSNIFFRMLDDLNRNFDKTQDTESKEEIAVDDLIGTTGLSETILRPTGRGRFNGQLLHVTTRGEFISAHIPIKIIQKSGGLYVVEEYAEGNI